MTNNKLRSRSDSVVQLGDRERSIIESSYANEARRDPWQSTTRSKQASSFRALA